MSLEALAEKLNGGSFIFEETPELLPGTDFHDGVLYVTLPISKRRMVEVGRGKNKTQVEKVVRGTVCVTSERDHFDYDEDTVTERGFRFPDTFTQDTVSRWPLPDLQNYLHGKAPIIDGKALFEELREIYRTHLEFADETYYEILPLFIMQTYIFRLFKATGYLHFHGTAASGKSQNLRLLSAFAFNTIWASSMTEASLFRRIAGCPGTICVDEAEKFDSERGQQLRTILLAGYLATTKAIRAEKIGEKFETIEYDVYSPKVLASINPQEPVLQSRCLVVQMMPAIRAIPEFDPDHPKWTAVRTKLYLWAMQQAKTLDETATDWNERKRYVDASQLVNRAWQIVQAYIVVADHIGGRDLYSPLITFFNAYFEQMNRQAEETDRQRLILKVLPRVMFSKPSYTIEGSGPWFKLKDIHDVFIDHIDEDVREYYKTRQTSRHLSSLGWKERKTAHGGVNIRLPEDDVRAQFKRRKVSPFEEDLAWLEGERTYVNATPSTPTLFDPPPAEPEPTPGNKDDYSWVDELNDPEPA